MAILADCASCITDGGELQFRIKNMASLAWLQAQSLTNRARLAPADELESLVEAAANGSQQP